MLEEKSHYGWGDGYSQTYNLISIGSKHKLKSKFYENFYLLQLASYMVGRRPIWKTTKIDLSRTTESYLTYKTWPNLTARKQTVAPCHHGDWGSLDSNSGKEALIRLCLSPLPDWLSGLQFMTDMSLSQAGFALGRSTPQMIRMLANASSLAVFIYCLKRSTLDVFGSMVGHQLRFL